MRAGLAIGGAALAAGAVLALWPPSRRPLRAVLPATVLDVMGSAAFDYGRRDGRDPGGNVISRGPSLLDPTFARALQELFRQLRGDGWRPVLQEGWRSEARALWLERTSPDRTSGLNSTHRDGAAADIIDQRYGFTPGAEMRAFFVALDDRSVAMGLHRLRRDGTEARVGTNDSWDSPHVQLASTSQIARTRGRQGALASLAATRLSAFA